MAKKQNYNRPEAAENPGECLEFHLYGMDTFTTNDPDFGEYPTISYENPSIPPEKRAAFIDKVRIMRMRSALGRGHPLTPEQRAEVNRANAQKSTGPRTVEGKARSSLNSRRHGLTGQFMLMFGEDEEAYNIFALRLITSYQPVGAEEENLAQLLIDVSFLLNRSTAVELNSYTYDVLAASNRKAAPSLPGTPVHNVIAQIDAFRDDSEGARATDLLGRHRGRLQRLFTATRKSLGDLQQERRAVEAEFRALKAEHGANYRPDLHGPFRNTGFDPSDSLAYAHYTAAVGLDPRKLSSKPAGKRPSKLHQKMFSSCCPDPETTPATPQDPPFDPVSPTSEPHPHAEICENEPTVTPEQETAVSEIHPLLLPAFLVMPGQQHLPVLISHAFLTTTGEILPGDTRIRHDGDPAEDELPINVEILHQGPTPIYEEDMEEEGKDAPTTPSDGGLPKPEPGNDDD